MRSARLLALAVLLPLLLVAPRLATAAAAADTAAADAASERDRAQVRARHPELDFALLERFYEVYSPDLLAEWRRRAESGRAEESAEYLERLAAHFLQLEEVRRSDRAEYERLLEYERLQRQIRLLSREVQRLLALGGELLSQETEAARQDNLAQAQRTLRELLERAFDESLRQQLHEIDRLQDEVDALRRLVGEPRMSRQQTLARQYRKLPGQPLPQEGGQTPPPDGGQAPPARP